MWKRARIQVLTAVMTLALAGVPAPASASLRSVSDDALARSSAAAVQGRVVATSAHWDDQAGIGLMRDYFSQPDERAMPDSAHVPASDLIRFHD